MHGLIHVISKSKTKIDLEELLDKLIYSEDVERNFDYIQKCNLQMQTCLLEFIHTVCPSKTTRNGKFTFHKNYTLNKCCEYEYVYFEDRMMTASDFLVNYIFGREKPQTFYYQGALDYHI